MRIPQHGPHEAEAVAVRECLSQTLWFRLMRDHHTRWHTVAQIKEATLIEG